MFRAPQFTYPVTEVTPQCSAEGAEALARAYLEDISAYWRGDAKASRFGERLAAFCGARLPIEPTRNADAYSPHGAGGRGIWWYGCGDEVLGYIPGCATGYRIPMASIAELTRAVGGNPEQPAAIAVGRAQKSRTGGVATLGYAAQPALAHVQFEHPAAMGVVA